MAIKEKVPFQLDRPDENTPLADANAINVGDTPLDEHLEETYGAYQDFGDFINVVTDAEGHIFEAIDKNGVKHHYLSEQFHGGLDIENFAPENITPGNINFGDSANVYATENEEFLYLITDEAENIYFGVTRDGDIVTAASQSKNKEPKKIAIYPTLTNNALNDYSSRYSYSPWGTGNLPINRYATTTQVSWDLIDWVISEIQKFGLGAIHFFYGYGNSGYSGNLKLAYNYFIHRMNELGVKVQMTFEGLPAVNDVPLEGHVSYEDWITYITEAVTDFNGVTQIPVGKDGETLGTAFVNIYNVLDEIASNYVAKGYTPLDILTILKGFYDVVKEVSPNASVGCPVMNIYNGTFLDAMFALDLDGTTFGDVFDITCLDPYMASVLQLPTMQQIYNKFAIYNEGIIKYPMISCNGFNEWSSTAENCSVEYVKSALIQLSAGAEHYSPFSLICNSARGDEDGHWGISYPLLDNSYMSFYIGSIGNYASVGPRSGHLYLNFAYDLKSRNYQYLHVDSSNLQRLKNNGLIITGSHFTISKVAITDGSVTEKAVLFEGIETISTESDTLVIASSSLSSLSSGDDIRVYFDANSITQDWTDISGAEYSLAYSRLKKLSNLLNIGCTKPTLRLIDAGNGVNLYVVYWANQNDKSMFAIWSNSQCSIKLEGSNHKVYDIDWNMLGIGLDKLSVTTSVFYIRDAECLTIILN